MSAQAACIFCEIASHKRPARIVEESEGAVAFLDAFPLAEGHLLVIPRTHVAKVQQMTKDDARAVFELVWKLSGALETVTKTDGATIAVHNGRSAGQEIPHVHFHVIPRKPDDGAGPVHTMFRTRPQLTSDQLDALASEISLAMKQAQK